MRTLHEGTRLGDVFPVESLKQVHEMLGVDSDDDELLDVRASITGGGGCIERLQNIVRFA